MHKQRSRCGEGQPPQNPSRNSRRRRGWSTRQPSSVLSVSSVVNSLRSWDSPQRRTRPVSGQILKKGPAATGSSLCSGARKPVSSTPHPANTARCKKPGHLHTFVDCRFYRGNCYTGIRGNFTPAGQHRLSAGIAESNSYRNVPIESGSCKN